MFGSTEPGEFSKRDLGEDDLEALCYIYPSDELTPRGTLTAEPAPLKLEGTSCRISPSSRSGRFGVLVLVGVALLVVLAGSGGREKTLPPPPESTYGRRTEPEGR